MDGMSWRAKLAKSNINILNIDEDRWYYEFMYHPRPGQTKWCKTYYTLKNGVDTSYSEFTHKYYMGDPETIANNVMKEVLSLRKELEG